MGHYDDCYTSSNAEHWERMTRSEFEQCRKLFEIFLEKNTGYEELKCLNDILRNFKHYQSIYILLRNKD